MEQKPNISNSTSFALADKVKDYFVLIKFTLSFLVSFSAVVSFLIAPYQQIYTRSTLSLVLLLFIAGMLITGAANGINQAAEKDTDALMRRTAKRPVASGKMKPLEAYIFSSISALLGLGMMWYFFNFQSAAISAFSFFLYGFIYTPLKRINSISVLVGAVPGALPCLIGWVAATNSFSIGGWVLFAIQFLWQFPHFWAIAWLAHGDYTKAGFKLLPSEKGPTKFTAVQSIIYSVMMVPIGFLPYIFGISGVVSFFILLFCNLWMVYVSVMLYKRMTAKSARMVMFSAYFYLMIVLLSLYADKVHV